MQAAQARGARGLKHRKAPKPAAIGARELRGFWCTRQTTPPAHIIA